MKKKTIKDAYKVMKDAPTSRFINCLNSTLFTGKAWADEYKTHYASYDPLAISLFGELVLDDIVLDEYGNPDFELISDYMTAEMLSNTHMYDTMWDALLLEYEPLWNVDGVEITEYGRRHKTSNIGERTDTDTAGTRTETIVNGERVTTVDTDDRYTTSDNGARVQTVEKEADTSTNQMSADNDTGFSNDTRTTNTIGDTTTTDNAYIDLFHADSTTDTTTTDESTDTRTNSGYVDTHKHSSATDSETEDIHTDTVTRHGNIGLTSSQQLLLQQLDVAKVNFYKMLMRDACASISIPLMI